MMITFTFILTGKYQKLCTKITSHNATADFFCIAGVRVIVYWTVL